MKEVSVHDFLKQTLELYDICEEIGLDPMLKSLIGYRMLEEFTKHGILTTPELVEMLGVSKGPVHKYIAKFREIGILEPLGKMHYDYPKRGPRAMMYKIKTRIRTSDSKETIQ